jgi:hypothetical protein
MLCYASTSKNRPPPNAFSFEIQYNFVMQSDHSSDLFLTEVLTFKSRAEDNLDNDYTPPQSPSARLKLPKPAADPNHDSISEPLRVMSKFVSLSWKSGVVAEVVAKILNDWQRKVPQNFMS